MTSLAKRGYRAQLRPQVVLLFPRIYESGRVGSAGIAFLLVCCGQREADVRFKAATVAPAVRALTRNTELIATSSHHFPGIQHVSTS